MVSSLQATTLHFGVGHDMTGDLTINPLPGSPFGAEITGLDPRAITEAQSDAIWDAYRHHHGLLCFSFGRLLEADELHALTAVFGENEYAPGRIHGIGKRATDGQQHLSVEDQAAQIRARGEDPYLIVIGSRQLDTGKAKPVDDKFYGEWEWHTDMSYIEVPPTFSLLHSREIPDDGADTGFCSQVLAARALPPALRKRALDARVKHDSTYGSSGKLRPGMTPPASPIEALGHAHPVIRTVPSTGDEAIFLGRRTNGYVVGLLSKRAKRSWTNSGLMQPGPSSATGTNGRLGRSWHGTTACCCTCAIPWTATRRASCGAPRPRANPSFLPRYDRPDHRYLTP